VEWTAGGFDRFGQGLHNNILDMNGRWGPSSTIDPAVKEIYASIRATRLGGRGDCATTAAFTRAGEDTSAASSSSRIIISRLGGTGSCRRLRLLSGRT